MQFMTSEHQYISRKDEGDRVIVFERGDLVFVFNFHWSDSYFDYRVGCSKPGKYKVKFSLQFSKVLRVAMQNVLVLHAFLLSKSFTYLLSFVVLVQCKFYLHKNSHGHAEL